MLAWSVKRIFLSSRRITLYHVKRPNGYFPLKNALFSLRRYSTASKDDPPDDNKDNDPPLDNQNVDNEEAENLDTAPKLDDSESPDGNDSIDDQHSYTSLSDIRSILTYLKDDKKIGRSAQKGKIRRNPLPLKESDSNDDIDEADVRGQTDQASDDSTDSKTFIEVIYPKGENLPALAISQRWPRLHAIFALGLYKKPAFPGFYQVLQIQDPFVLQSLSNARNNLGHDFIGGFLVKEPISEIPTLSNFSSLREDAGAVSKCEEMHSIGTLLQIISIAPHINVPGGQAILMPYKRIRMTGYYKEPDEANPLYRVAVDYIEDKFDPNDDVIKALHLEIIATMKNLLKTSHFYKEHFDQVIRFYNLDYPHKLADLIAGMSMGKRSELQKVLEELDMERRLTLVLELARSDYEFAKIQMQVKSQVEQKMTSDQKKYMLMEQLKMIKKELGLDVDDKQSVIDAFDKDFAECQKYMPEEGIESYKSSISRLSQLEISSAEFGVCRAHLEWLLGLPWGKQTTDERSISKARSVLDSHHFGLKDVKERLLEFIAVTISRGDSHGKILCLVGPPGVGKTSIGASIAEALNKRIYRLSVGGLFDVAELKGHRRTYVGALPGKIVQALRYTKCFNPLILLDEIDKLGKDIRGDPASALLEILDFSQNNSFRDLYLDIPIDLSKVLFVCTANVTDTIPHPLMDRMEIIHLSGYLHEEKMEIAKRHLIPKCLKESGLNNIVFDSDCLSNIVKFYARESGVRQLEKYIEKILRKIALETIENAEKSETNIEDSSQAEKNVVLSDLQKYLGAPIFQTERLHLDPMPSGVVMGMAWTSMGGAILFVEASGKKSDSGAFKVTGHLGKVMNESSEIALSYAKEFVSTIDPSNNFLEESKIHLHVPEGATPKDGPSAGITMALALVSLALKKSCKSSIAMTGELTLTGKVLRIGGVKEKLVAAIREGVENVILPTANKADFELLEDEIKSKVNPTFVEDFKQVYQRAL